MANIRRSNVWVIDTTGQINGLHKIRSIKFVGGSDAATVTIKQDNTSGDIIYQGAATANQHVLDTDLNIKIVDGFYITLTGTAPKAYLYLE